ncbi:GlcG/HbpS family heme-binding protein [Parachryseolinea silvisoli]|jgi:glc operon protein GlcG|uniref:GlcG/HbpS family heme-binding protein n=1 Tax=Parachryseolinea silvisoli TaxID=2873601 RepID=UPI0022658598|nr:heme-binding protein [Parachryseolinea silvisoli]MCD9014871.1 heme-binding protein [Parachryseolinea silvisoli]
MYNIQKISSEEALLLIQYVVAQTGESKPVAISICGPEGELIGFLRMDGTSPAASRIAQNKAYTAAVDRTDTMKMGARMRGSDNPAFWGDERITGFGGGVPVVQNGVVVGGVGISGLPEADDERLAKEAVKHVFG